MATSPCAKRARERLLTSVYDLTLDRAFRRRVADLDYRRSMSSIR